MVALEDSKLFCQLGRKEKDALRCAAVERSFRAGAEIFHEGDPADGLYTVRTGRVEISVLVASGVRRVFSQLGPGQIFGEMGVLDTKPRSATAVAVEDTETSFITRDAMLKLAETSPALSLALLREVSSRLRDFNQQYMREVLQADRLAVIGRFARSIIHDLKNPLNVIGLSAEMAGMTETSPESRRTAIETIRAQVDRIGDMVGEILEFTQGTAKDVVLTPMRYSEFVADVLEELSAEAKLKSISVELAGHAPDVPLLFNPKRLRRVFQNLTHNAVEAMPDGGTVRWRFECGPAEVVTQIEDTGPGIPPEMHGCLFEPFATHGKVHGTGLGLSICKRILEDHHGWIAARERPGVAGACFAFGLPRAAAQQLPVSSL